MGRNEVEAQLETLYLTYTRSVFRYAVRRGSPKEDAEDVVIDTFVLCWKHLPQLPEQPLPWLIRATRGILANKRRARARENALCARIAQAEERTEVTEEAESHPSPKEKALLFAISELSEMDRETLLLVELDGLSAPETALAVGSSAQAVRHRLSRTRRLLREKLGMLYE